jgi:hypothetical protein
MKPVIIDIPTALIFFARPDLLKVTFEAIRKAKPNKLFLIQDGSRINNETDKFNIEKCRNIVSAIDWDCEVFRNYSEENLGCGMRVYSGIKWAFQHVDRLLVLEDDCVPAQSLFPFTEELLEKYKNDDRIGMICGMNNLGLYEEVPNDYLFTTSGSIWGWATWKRVWDNFEYNLEFLDDSYSTDLVFKTEKTLESLSDYITKNLKEGKKLTSWSFQLGMNMFLQSQLNIVPKHNLISNIGIAENGANSVSSIKFMPKGLRRLYFMKTYTLKFPITHPKYIVNDTEFKKKLDRLMGDGHPLVKFYRTVESLIYRVYGGDFKSIIKGFKRRYLS